MTPFDPTKFTVGLSIYDTPSQGQVLYAPEYISDIFQRLYYSEVRIVLFTLQSVSTRTLQRNVLTSFS